VKEIKREKDAKAKNFEKKLLDSAETLRKALGFDSMPTGTTMRMRLLAGWYENRYTRKEKTISEFSLESAGL
jgi:hypothetical protein